MRVVCNCITRLCVVVATAMPSSASEVVRLTRENYAANLPRGKESDAIIGDYILRNDRLVAVIADTAPGRRANMTTQRVGGCIIDLTRRDRQNDQLTAYYPGAMTSLFAKTTIMQASGPEARVVCETGNGTGSIRALVDYTLQDGQDFVRVLRQITNVGSQPAPVVLSDAMRADTSFTKSGPGPTDLYWAYDHWFGQAYGIVAEDAKMESKSDGRSATIYYHKNGGRAAELKPGEHLAITTRVFVAHNLVELIGFDRKAAGNDDPVISINVREAGGAPVGHAEVFIERDGAPYGHARTLADGHVSFALPKGECRVLVKAFARGESAKVVQVSGPAEIGFEVPAPPVFEATITDDEGGPIACKVEFQGQKDTPHPDFGPTTQGPAVKNLYYSHNGNFRWPVPPGKYQVLVSHGPEYDLATGSVEMKPGETTEFRAKLHRVVDSKGWVSAEIHSHSSPSGDNTTDMLGRVLNHLAEQIEFAPCTEHNRLETYVPILEKLGCKHRLATCTGMELTGQPLPLNHQNAFPLLYHPGAQDNGAPDTDPDPEVQIRRLAAWDNHSEKLVQTNHPDLGWMYFDRDGNGKQDAGFYRMFAFQDVIEVWGNDPQAAAEDSILAMRPITARQRNDRLFNWLQLLNQGYRIVGVGNSDAHYTDHGIGWIRNYVKSSTDHVEKIDTMEMVRQFQAGHVVNTNGPYLEASVRSGSATAISGDSLDVKNGKATVRVRVQCANWLDVNRIQLLLNGRADPKYNFTRAANRAMFSDGVVKFDRAIDVDLAADAHLIVVATGEGSNISNVYGAAFANVAPIAFTNPIYMDADGNGFEPNGDTLGHRLPVKADERKALPKMIREKAKASKTKAAE